MSVATKLTEEMLAAADKAEASHLMRFFKTGEGEYGEGDKFLGVRVPVTRAAVRQYRSEATLGDVEALTLSEYHELRLAGFLLLIEMYNRLKKEKDAESVRKVVDYYLSIIGRGNNWDLVDLVAPKILGDWLLTHPEDRAVLYDMAGRDDSLWHQRVAVVACWSLIRYGDYADTLRLAEHYLCHHHDLIHKATGWMLREVGKHGGRPELLAFLDAYAPVMPRTMLRYAIEHLSQEERRHYMQVR